MLSFSVFYKYLLLLSIPTVSVANELRTRKLEGGGVESNRIHDPDDPRIRYVAFGSSSTWGAGYPDEYDRHKFAYPWLLSPTATNLAIRAGGPNYPANCVSTMVDHQFFDVIIFEYFLLADQGLPLLARRLRERYPDALIIFLENWTPMMVSAFYEGDLVTAQEWAVRQGFERKNVHLDPKMHQLFKDSDLDWQLWQWYNPKFHEVLEKAADEVGGIVSTMIQSDNLRKDWYEYAHLFAADGHHLSMDGHAEVAERIRQIVRNHGVKNDARLGDFQYTDSCENWFESGKIEKLSFSDNGVVENMPHTPKYGLQFEGGEGWIQVHNPSSTEQTLYLGYMTTGPPPSKYPVTEMRVLSSEESEVVELDMNSSDVFGDKAVHISKLVEVGLIPPGDTRISFRQLEETERPFRLVSVLITTHADGTDGLMKRLPGGNDA